MKIFYNGLKESKMTQEQIKAVKQYKKRMTQARLALRACDVDINKEGYTQAFNIYQNALNNYCQFVRACKGVKQ